MNTVAKRPSPGRVARDSRERALHKLGTEWLRACKPLEWGEEPDADELARITIAAHESVPEEYGQMTRYPGPPCATASADADAALEQLAEALADPDPFGATEATEWIDDLPRADQRAAARSIGAWIDAQSSGRPRGLRCRQLPVHGVPDRSHRRYVAHTHYTTGNLVGTQENGADRVIPLRTIHMGTTALTIYAT